MTAQTAKTWGAIRPLAVAEIAENQNSIGLSAYRLTVRLPEGLKGSLPTVKGRNRSLTWSSRRWTRATPSRAT